MAFNITSIANFNVFGAYVSTQIKSEPTVVVGKAKKMYPSMHY